MQILDRFEFEDIRIRNGWNNALRVIAVHRYQEFLPEIGVPPAIADNPEPAVNAARNALRGLSSVNHRSNFGRNVVGFMASIATYDADRVVEDLVDWVTRYFVDSATEIAWYGWSSVLPMLAGAYFPDHYPRIPSPLDLQSTRRFTEIVRAHFIHSEFFDTERRLEEAATRIELSDEELDWLRLEPTGFAGEPEYIFLGDIVSLLIGKESAFRVWQEIKNQFSLEQQELVCDWAEREFREEGRGSLIQFSRVREKS